MSTPKTNDSANQTLSDSSPAFTVQDGLQRPVLLCCLPRLVPVRGLEPLWYYHGNLNPTCLPISPYRHIKNMWLELVWRCVPQGTTLQPPTLYYAKGCDHRHLKALVQTVRGQLKMCETTKPLEGGDLQWTRKERDLTDRTPSTSLERLARPQANRAVGSLP